MVSVPPEALADFTFQPRALFISVLALPLGVLSAVLAYILLHLIAIFTNVFFFQTLSFSEASPADAALGPGMLVVPVAGAAMVALMARYGSEKIRGHGIPEAIEAILINGSRVEPKVAVLKPVSAAISIGSGGPFGAEGPIIMTGGSFGSLAAQLFHLSSAERKALLVAGAAGGMSATFASPFAAVLLAVELLLFEWKPRSLVPVAVASLTALLVRRAILGPGPLFPTDHVAALSLLGMLGCVGLGLLGGGFSALLTTMVYAAEDAFQHLPIHWVWWPPIGGLAIGIGGLFFPRALGVGYETIGELLSSDLTLKTMLGVLVVKSIIWSVSLGSGTSGGVLAPLLMMGAAMGGVAANVLPDAGPGYWALVGMAAVLGGTMRLPFTAVVFALELTHDMEMMVPLLAASMTAYAFTALTMKRSILTEKLSRRGMHLSREYSVDPLELHFVREVMRTDFVTLSALPGPSEIEAALASDQSVFPVRDAEASLEATVTRNELLRLLRSDNGSEVSMVVTPANLAYPAQTLRSLVHQLARNRRTHALVVGANGCEGIVELADILKAYEKNLGTEERRERHIALSIPRRSRSDAEVPLR